MRARRPPCRRVVLRRVHEPTTSSERERGAHRVTAQGGCPASAALKEVDVGAWSGLTVHEVEDRYPEGFARWVEWRCAGWSDGETYEQLGLRVVAGLREIAVNTLENRFSQ